jgi:PAS domain S-box-containing protein
LPYNIYVHNTLGEMTMNEKPGFHEQALIELIQQGMMRSQDPDAMGNGETYKAIWRKLQMAFAGGLPAAKTLTELCRSRQGKEGTEQDVEAFLSDFAANIEWFLRILNAIHDGIMVADENAIVRFINPAYTRLTTVKAADIIGKNLGEVRPSARLPQVIRQGKPMLGVHRKVGDIEYVVDMHPIIVDGKILGGVTIARDITEIQELNKRLKGYTNKVDTLINRVREQNLARYNFSDILGTSAKFIEVKRLAHTISASEINVLIKGESGTGKELFAHAIHNASNRSQGPFVAVNCAAIPITLLESELFGYEGGAFTGAQRTGKIGLMEIADQGTIFLDEIGDMNIELQAKLLRVLQTGVFQRVGGTENMKVDLRVIAATNRDLEVLIQRGLFREDLYYRLNVAQLRLPPLRERREDIELLAEYFLAGVRRPAGPIRLSEEAKKALKHYAWPGNIRELENAITFLANITSEPVITVSDFPESYFRNTTNGLLDKPSNHNEGDERQTILAALKRYGWTVRGKKEAARALGISLATLYNKINSYNIR